MKNDKKKTIIFPIMELKDRNGVLDATRIMTAL